jgi:O-antigen ligase
MLSQESYPLALYVYLGAGGAFLLCLGWWLGRSWGAGWAVLLVLLSAALLLTPAYPNADTDTLAPAIVVAGFQFFTEGPEAAEHALRPLGAACLAALVLAASLRFTVFRRRRGDTSSNSAGNPE